MRQLSMLMTGLFMLLCTMAIAQKTVTGKVTDAKDGSPLAGVSVKVKGSDGGTSTAADGTFTVSLPKFMNDLIFSFIGYDDQEVAVKGNSVSISLSSTVKSLNEVVVVGYGTTVKRELTGAIGKVKGAEIKDMPVPNLNQALQGRAAGVFVESQNGKVGEGIKVRIRGAGSVNSSNQPLYVVDGIPLSAGAIGSSTADINFNDVESFEILKDASASAIYGSRAANGVVIITTKRGKSGKTKFNLGTQFGTNEPTHKRGFLNAQEYIEFFQAAGRGAAEYHMRPDGGGNWGGFTDLNDAYAYFDGVVTGRLNRYSGWIPYRGGVDWKTGQVNTNWEDLAFQDAKTSQYELTAQGGNDKTKFYMAANVNSQDGILVGNKFQRAGVRLNLDHQVNNWLKIGMNTSLAKITRNRVPEDNEFSTPMQSVALSPITPVRDTAGKLFDRPVATYYNPLIDVEEAINKVYSYRNQGSIFTDIRLTKGLTFHADLGLDMITQNEELWYGPRTQEGSGTAAGKGLGTSYWFRNARWINNDYVNYSGTFGEKHKIDATAGFAFENTEINDTYAEGQDFPDIALKTLASASTPTDVGGTYQENNLRSLFARLNYTYNGKYLLGASIRNDADSRLGTNYKDGTFWSASLGWLMSEEKFMQGFKAISFLKPRVSYGTSGNNTGIGFYQATSQYGSVTYGNSGGLGVSNFGNDDLRWENVAMFDVGIDFGFFDNRLTGEVDWYNKKTTDMLLNTPVTAVSGTTAILGNVGEMENKGIELTLNSVNVQNKDWRWTTSINVSKNKNKLLKLDGEQTEILPNDARFANALIIGQPIGVFYAPKFLGANPDNGDPQFLGADGKPTREYDDAQRMIIGDPNPDWFAGLTNTVTWKGLEFSFLFQGVFGNQVMDGAGGFMSASGDWFDNQTRDQLNAWKKPGDVTMVPQARLNWLGDWASPLVSSRYMYDASYVRLKSLTLAYNVPTKWMGKVGLNTARVYLSGVNLLTFTDYPGWDPEVNTDYRAGNVNQGGDFYAAPQIKSWVFGLNLGF
ncbi:MAG TPA: TonB-dependent receptor [Phnomibacter sp.]|nr:TonB-dependent receptor [Phnomibacter sp.]